MKLTRQQELELMQVYETWWKSYINGDVKTYDSFLDDDYRFVGSTNGEEFLDRKDTTAFFNATADQLAGKVEVRNLKRTIEALDGGLVLITDLADAYVISESEWVFYSRFRFTSLMKETIKGWRFIYQHFSAPDTKAQEGETLGTQQITKENEELRDAVKRRTVELEHKTKELEIEAALERVRTVAMGMKKPDDLLRICEILFKELQALGFSELRNALIHTFVDEKRYFDDYDYSDFTGGSISRIPYTGHPVIERFIKAIRKKDDAFSEITVSGEELSEWKAFRKTNGEVDDARLDNIKVLYYYSYSVGSGGIGISTYSSISNEKQNVLRRFRNVFDLAYKRYIDITGAEAQAREAQIELALERVRARTMAMQTSDELPEAANVLFQQIQSLGMPAWSAGYCIWDDDKQAITAWMSSEGVLQPPFKAPLTEDPSFIHMREADDQGKTFYVEAVGGEALVTHYQYMRTLPVVGEILDSIIEAGHPLPTFQIFHCAYFSRGFLLFITYEPVQEAHDIFKRFGNVFDQTYTRFLDLQKAEAQAREAQIEAALERVRSRTMGMQHSHELTEVANLLFMQVRALGVPMWGCGFNLWEKEDRYCDAWLSSEGLLQPPVKIPLTEDPIFIRLYESRQKGELFYAEEVGGEALANHYRYLMGIPGFSAIHAKYTGAGFTVPTSQVNNVIHFSHGNLVFISPTPVPEARGIFKRFTTVFEQAYTRFLDLQKAETQAREAQIEAALERVRSRTLAMQKSDELAETAAVLFHQLVLLGIEPNRLYMGIIKDDDGHIEFWATDEEGSKVSTQFIGDASRNASMKKMYSAWRAEKRSLTIDMQGNELNDYFQYMTDELKVPFTKGLSQKRRIQTIAIFGKGFLGIASPGEQPEETTHLLERFAAVFNLTYTRFNDLKIAEAHAIQAEEDLIKLQTEKKRAEEALAELKETQKQLIQSEKMASLGELTAGIAHEIQNPLNFVNNFSEINGELIEELLIEKSKEKTERDEALEIELLQDIKENEQKINHHGKRADAIVKGMLQHSRSSSGVKEPTDINALADEYLRLAYHGLRAKDKLFNATMNTDYDETLGKVHVIPQDIGRVVLNLINNAFYAVVEKKKQQQGYEPTVTITTKQVGNKVAISVKDNGNGIPESIKDKIFQPFFTTKPTGQGTGLGLSLSYDIVKGHGGEIKVDSKEGEGTEFIVQLPVV